MIEEEREEKEKKEGKVGCFSKTEALQCQRKWGGGGGRLERAQPMVEK